MNVKKWIKWILDELIPDYYEQVEYAGIGSGVSLDKLNECEMCLRSFLKSRCRK